jgi:guanine deaminase
VPDRGHGAATANASFLTEAIRLAEENVRNGGGPFGCVIVKDGRVIARGVNRVTATNDPTAHAEIVAIREACHALGAFQLDGCEIYASCEPCPMCLGAIYWARPALVVFAASRSEAASAGFDDARIYSELPLPIERRSIPTQHLPVEDRTRPFETWRDQHGKIAY